MGFPKRYDGELREILFRSQGSQVYMRMAMGSGSLLSSHGRGIGPQDAPKASLKITLLMKAQHLGALTPLGIVRTPARSQHPPCAARVCPAPAALQGPSSEQNKDSLPSWS